MVSTEPCGSSSLSEHKGSQPYGHGGCRTPALPYPPYLHRIVVVTGREEKVSAHLPISGVKEPGGLLQEKAPGCSVDKAVIRKGKETTPQR